MKEHHHWLDGVVAAAAWITAHLDAPVLIQVLTIAMLTVRLALGIREWFTGRKSRDV